MPCLFRCSSVRGTGAVGSIPLPLPPRLPGVERLYPGAPVLATRLGLACLAQPTPAACLSLPSSVGNTHGLGRGRRDEFPACCIALRRQRSRTALPARHLAGVGRLAHAYLFVGPRHVGRRTLALWLARLVNCDQAKSPNQVAPLGPDSSAPAATGSVRPLLGVCRRIMHGNYPDVMVVEPEVDEFGEVKRGVLIEQIREVVERRAPLRPYEGRTKVFVIRGADTMTDRRRRIRFPEDLGGATGRYDLRAHRCRSSAAAAHHRLAVPDSDTAAGAHPYPGRGPSGLGEIGRTTTPRSTELVCAPVRGVSGRCGARGSAARLSHRASALARSGARPGLCRPASAPGDGSGYDDPVCCCAAPRPLAHLVAGPAPARQRQRGGGHALGSACGARQHSPRGSGRARSPPSCAGSRRRATRSSETPTSGWLSRCLSSICPISRTRRDVFSGYVRYMVKSLGRHTAGRFVLTERGLVSA